VATVCPFVSGQEAEEGQKRKTSLAVSDPKKGLSVSSWSLGKRAPAS